MRYEYRHGGNAHLEPGGERFLDFSASVNPFGPPKTVQTAIAGAMCFIDRYPDTRSAELRESIAEFEHVPAEWIFCGAGSSDILFRLPRAVDARSALLLRPSFSDYERALTAACVDISFYRLEEQNGFVCDERLLGVLESRPVDLLVLCNPNNPTGTLTERRLIEQILRPCRETKTTVLVDECFMDLTEEADAATTKSLLSEFGNLVLLKAFTKTFALPGLRLGYALCSDMRRIDGLYSSGPDWPVSNLAQAAGIAALQDAKRYLKESVEMIGEERRFVKGSLEKLGYQVFDGKAGFLLAKNPYNFDMRKALDGEFIRIRSFGAEDGLGPNYFRVGISTRENNVRLIDSVQKIMRQKTTREMEGSS